MNIIIDEGWRLLRSGLFTELFDELGGSACKHEMSRLKSRCTQLEYILEVK
jgi:hypothetical protein